MRVKILEQILDFLFPARCIGCGKFGSYLCENCFGKIEFLSQQFCPVCGHPAISGFTHPGCKTPFCLDGSLSIANYNDIMHSLVSSFKYQPFVTDLQKSIRAIFSSFFTRSSQKAPRSLGGGGLVTPVPLHWMRKNWRGFNQAEILAKIISEILSLEFTPNVLKRERFTKPQTQLKRKERLKNVQGIFALEKDAKEKIQNKSILLVDDVWTTGATIKECGKLLKRNGAASVWALTLTRPIKKPR